MGEGGLVECLAASELSSEKFQKCCDHCFKSCQSVTDYM